MDEPLSDNIKALITKLGITELDLKDFVPAHEQDWQQPLLFDWEGKEGPPFTEEDIYNSELSRIIRDDFQPPWDDSNGQQTSKNPPDLDPIRTNQKRYPRLSSLTKQQHLLGLKVLCAHYGVQPCPSPTLEDFQSFEEIKELYEQEQKEYRVWARNCWNDGDCIRTLVPINVVETVYRAQFELKKNKIQTIMYNDFIRAGYISLESRMEDFEFKPIQELKSVDVQVLPNISYPDKFEQSYRDMDTYGVPKPCPQHPCKFILPCENEVTSLSLHEIHVELAHFAIENGTEFIASENAIQCLLDIERGWKLPMSVVEVVCQDGGVKTVVVLDSPFSLQKESGAQRTHDSFRHLLRNIFTTNTEDSKEVEEENEEKSPNVNEQRRCSPEIHKVSYDESNSNAPSKSDISRFSSKPDRPVIDDDSSSNEDKLQIDVDEQPRRSPEIHKVSYDESNSNAPSESFISRFGSEPHRPVIDDDSSSNEDKLQIDVDEQPRRSPKIHKVSYDESNSNAPSESFISRFGSEPDRPVIDDDSSSNEDKLQIDVDDQPRRSLEIHKASYDDSNSIAPSKSDISRFSSKPDRPVIEDDSSSNEDELQIDVDEQPRRSPEIHKVSYDESNSNAPSESFISRFGSEPDRPVIDDDSSSNEDKLQIDVDEQPRRSPKIHKVSYDESNSNAPSESFISRFGSEPDRPVIDDDSSSNEDKLQIDVDDQPRRSLEIHKASYDDSNSIAPSKSDISRFSSKPDRPVIEDDSSSNEDELQIDVDEQRRRSPEIHKVSYSESNSNAPSDSNYPSCSSERNRLVIDEEFSVPDKRDNETEAELSRKQKFSLYFGNESDEESCQSEAESEVAVPREEQKENNFAGEYTDMEKAQTNNQSSLDTATLPTNNENLNFRHIDGVSCTCAMSKEPFPRSFKKWQVKSAASSRSYNIIIHASHKTRKGEREVILEPIVEWQPELGACEQSAGKLRALALALMMRPKAEIMNVRMNYETGDIIMIDKLDEEQFMRRHGDKRSEIADTIHKFIVQLLFLKPGQYILVHDRDNSVQVAVCAPLAEIGGASSCGFTFSLRPKKDFLTDAEEATLSKIPPTLSRAILPYHKEKGVLPLAFTTAQRLVTRFKKKTEKTKVNPARAQASKKRTKKRKARGSGTLKE